MKNAPIAYWELFWQEQTHIRKELHKYKMEQKQRGLRKGHRLLVQISRRKSMSLESWFSKA